jgi:glycosyltransferase involved in cell wall biosynthesis
VTTHPRTRIAHVSLGLDTGGQERLLVEFARCADKSRFELTFVSLTTRGTLAAAIEEHGCRVIALGDSGGFRPSLVGRLRKLFRERRIDVVHTHDDRPLTYGVPAARLAGARAIHTQHHGRLPGQKAHHNFASSWIGRLTSAFVTVSLDSARHHVQTGVPRAKVRTLWNGIDLDRFAFRGPAIGGPVVTVARLCAEKDIATLLRASRIVRDQDPAFRLEIAGDGPCREELVRLTHELELGPAVKFLGEVRDVPELLSRANLFVLSSKSEGISLTILEAMALGLPVAATAVGGTPEAVIDGQTGRLVRAESPDALAAAILGIRRHEEDAQLMGRAGRRRVESFFDIRQMVAQYERLYLGEPATVSAQPQEASA